MHKLYGILFLGLCCLLSKPAQSQTIENVQTTFDGERMTIVYDLVYKDPAQKFNVSILSSHDNYQKPLSLLIGASGYGDNVLPGKGIRVIWDAKTELPSDFNQDISIRVKAVKMAPAIKLTIKPFDQNTYKKGGPIEVRWLGGEPSNKINIQLFRENVVTNDIAKGVPNDEHFTWIIPQKTAAGGKYVVRISNADEPTELSNSQFIKIKPRTPFLLKVLPFLAAGGIAYVIINNNNKKSTGPTGDADLPGLENFIPN